MHTPCHFDTIAGATWCWVALSTLTIKMFQQQYAVVLLLVIWPEWAPEPKHRMPFCCQGQGQNKKVISWWGNGWKKQRGQQLYCNVVWNNQTFFQQNDSSSRKSCLKWDSSESTLNLQPIPAARSITVDLEMHSLWVSTELIQNLHLVNHSLLKAYPLLIMPSGNRDWSIHLVKSNRCNMLLIFQMLI